jgi:tRNA modification GTPase
LALIEAEIDFFDEEDIHFIEVGTVSARLAEIIADIHHVVTVAVRVDRVDTLPTVVFIGKPNVGKSSLVNALTEQDRAMTSPVAGTTRDMLSAVMASPHGTVRVIDVPGEEPASDELRVKMMATRQMAIEEADLIVEVLDETASPGTLQGADISPPAATLRIQNKGDLVAPEDRLPLANEWQLVSAKTGMNIDRLRDAIATLATHGDIAAAHRLTLNQRHRLTLQRVIEELRLTADLAADPATFVRHPELLASDLRRAMDLLGTITGAISPDEILGRIFSTFCIGK